MEARTRSPNDDDIMCRFAVDAELAKALQANKTSPQRHTLSFQQTFPSVLQPHIPNIAVKTDLSPQELVSIQPAKIF